MRDRYCRSGSNTFFLFLCPSLSYFNHPLSVLFCAPNIKESAIQKLCCLLPIWVLTFWTDHNSDERSLPQTIHPGWNIRWNRIRWHVKILLKNNTSFEPCSNLTYFCIAAWVKLIWVAVSKDVFNILREMSKFHWTVIFLHVFFCMIASSQFCKFCTVGITLSYEKILLKS